MFQKVLVPTEGSEASLKAVKKAFQLLEEGFAKEVTFLYVGSNPWEGYTEGFTKFERDEFVDNAKKIAEGINKRIKEIFGSKEFKMQSEFGNVPYTICKVAEDGKYDLIVVGHRGLNQVERYFLGSVSNKVANTAPCSVLIVR